LNPPSIRPGQRKPVTKTPRLLVYARRMFKAQRGGTFADKSQPPEPDMTTIPKAITTHE
jgi:hypothetical protein